MKQVVIEMNVRVKSIWEVPEDFEMRPFVDPREVGTRLSTTFSHISPETIRPLREGELITPAPEQSTKENAERGYWGRVMNEWRKSLQLEDHLKG